MEENQNNPTAESTSAVVKAEKRRYPWLALLSLLLCIGAWVVSTFDGFLCLGIGAIGIVAGAFSLGSHRPAVRNTAITSIIATVVLMLVVGAFIIALKKLLPAD